ncbi:MAG: hypothetical protein BMS9Abin05_2152 [Rhodothermia bacterium]|nr:MAG: hypothetical protein BMS9Abin05_2152 [Rhodothermia bacterium]
MPGMAARLGDPTAHGGVIVLGFPMVLIGGMPAARVGDMHVCPMVTPGTPPIPHVGMPIASPGAPTVLIGGMPAATVGSIAPCVGPPDSVMMGCPTVMLGAGGAGSASGGGGGGGGGAAAHASAAAALFDNNESVTKEEHWIEFEFVDKAGLPVSGIHYKLTDPDSNESEGVLRMDGKIRRDALNSEGQGKVILMSVSEAKWSKEEADVGETIKMSAKAEGFEDGTKAVIQVFKRDISGPDVVVAEVETEVSGEKVEKEWTFEYGPEWSDSDDEEIVSHNRYSHPVFYFDVVVTNDMTRSGLLLLKDWIEIELIDENEDPVADQEYAVYFSNGEVRRGTLDSSGTAREENVPPVTHEIGFPNMGTVTENID